ncbi:cell wall hydrolase [Neobacillus niacini]|uniref:cell wall hydrolase n=1 Tax=Neobacillus niacini TaxID=86668 RepID=UPI00285936EB|nr:cell wall hydrolase [Neobacillus niacini]MDR6999232.1 N-acetylmuramoyl-L-alanine amidase [Neobacillus niacini]
MLKKCITAITILVSLLFTTPTFAYTVKDGDTVETIAQDHFLTLKELTRLNPQIENNNAIYIGQYINTIKPKHKVGEPLQIGKNTNTAEPEYITKADLKIRQAIRKSKPKINTKSTPKSMEISAYEKDLLARLVRAEAQNEPFNGKVAVACVVLNRVESKKFPNSISSVIYARGQFQPVLNGQINKPTDKESLKAVNEALRSKRDLVGSSLFFYNPKIAQSRWLDTRPTTLVIGRHVFKK